MNIASIVIWKDYYFVYNHSVLPVIGLMFSRSLTKAAFISVLMWYLTDKGGTLEISAILSNIHNCLSACFVLIVSNVADSLIGRFRALWLSNISCIIGLLLLLLFNPNPVQLLLVLALILLALGTSVSDMLDDLLIDMVVKIDNLEDDERSVARATFWSSVAQASGAISATLWVAPGAIGGTNPSWSNALLICLISIATTLGVFCIRHESYHHNELIKRPIGTFLGVIGARIQKYPQYSPWWSTNTSRQDKQTENLESQSLPLDNREDGEEMIVLKSLIYMVPLWGMYLVVSLVSAIGSTFFFEQSSNLNNPIEFPVQIYSLVESFSRFASNYFCGWIIGRCSDEWKNIVTKVTLGIGMVCGIISCVFAWQLEVHRLKDVNTLLSDDEDESISISFLWLVPQFCMLGCMEGLANRGLLELFKSEIIYERIRSYGMQYIDFVEGLGYLMNIFLILIFQSKVQWFNDTINDSRLDKYYIVMIYVSSANFVIYCCIATCFFMGANQSQNEAQPVAEEVFNDSQNGQEAMVSESLQDYQSVAEEVFFLDDSE